jgi:predicted MarR family transcription regulator
MRSANRQARRATTSGSKASVKRSHQQTPRRSSNGSPLTAFEFELAAINSSLSRWVVNCVAAAGYRDLSILDATVLQNVDTRARGKSIAEVCFIMNIEENHVVSYSIKKLVNMSLLEATKRRKDVVFSTTAAGHALCSKYWQARDRIFLPLVDHKRYVDEEFHRLAQILKRLTGLYDQAARAVSL